MRLSVNIEFAAFMYDCLHDGEGSRRLAKKAIKDVYDDQEGMSVDMFEDATEQVQILGKMTRRGLGGSGGSSGVRVGSAGGVGSGGGEGSTPRGGSEISTPRATKTPKSNASPEVTANGNGVNGTSRRSPRQER